MNKDELVQDVSINSSNKKNLIFKETHLESTTRNLETETGEQIILNTNSIFNGKYGRTKCFLFYNKDPLIVIGPHWLFYFSLSLAVFLSFCLVFIVFGNYIKSYSLIIGIVIYLIHFFIYSIAAFKNPGIPSLTYFDKAKADPQRYKACSQCGLLVDIEADFVTYHCPSCDVCIEGYDHHCPWTTKCIGKGNLWFFYFFVASLFLYIGFIFLALAILT
jgi:palmitoyltransferase ZDHHC9/14/18